MNPLLAQLGVVCPRCDAYNPPASTACATCKAPLAAASTSIPPPGPPRVAPAPVIPAARAAEAAPKAAPPAPVPPPVLAPAPAAPGVKLRLVVVRGQHGSAGSSFKLSGSLCPAGRSKGILLFPNDPFVAPHHCTFSFRDGKLLVKDEGSPSGTFVSISQEPLQPGAVFAVGDTALRYVGPLAPAAPQAAQSYGAPLPPGPVYLVEEVLEGARPGRCLARTGPTMAVGQAGCEFVVADPLVAPRHCELTLGPLGATLRDLGSPAGTFVRLPPGGERALGAGDQVRLGNEVLKVEVAP